MARRGDYEDDYDDEEEEIDYVLFQGAMNDAPVDLEENRRLTHAGLMPAKELVTDALMRRANRVRIEPKGPRAQVILYIDGVAYPGGRLPKQQANAITQMMKLLSGLDINVRNKKQKGGVKAELEDIKYELLVTSEPIQGGAERLTIGVRNTKEDSDAPRDLGISDSMRDKIREKSANKRGLIVVCGPPGSGVTTTTVGVARSVDSFIYTVFTIADMEGRDITNITPQKYREDDDLDTLTTRLERVDCDVLYLGPIENSEGAKDIVAQAEKFALISEMPAKDAAHGLCQLIAWLESPELVNEKIDLVISPKLIRKLCEKCRKAYRPHPKLLAKLGLPPETKRLYRAPEPPHEEDEDFDEYEPCPKCGGLGYYGQTGLYEVIELNDQMKQLVAKKPSPEHVRAAAKKLGMQNIQAEGLRLVAEGVTSLDELQRIFKSR